MPVSEDFVEFLQDFRMLVQFRLLPPAKIILHDQFPSLQKPLAVAHQFPENEKQVIQRQVYV